MISMYYIKKAVTASTVQLSRDFRPRTLQEKPPMHPEHFCIFCRCKKRGRVGNVLKAITDANLSQATVDISVVNDAALTCSLIRVLPPAQVCGSLSITNQMSKILLHRQCVKRRISEHPRNSTIVTKSIVRKKEKQQKRKSHLATTQKQALCTRNVKVKIYSAKVSEKCQLYRQSHETLKHLVRDCS